MNETAVDLRACINNKAMSHVAMPRYGCHKEVHAMPLTRGEYNDVRGWTIPENENPDDEGYLVVYNLGTADEYVSWSPKHIFNDGYHQLDTFGRHLDQTDTMIIEHNELMAKLVKLNEFMDSDRYEQLESNSKYLVFRQNDCMASYEIILRKRLESAGCIQFTGTNWPELVEKFGGGELVDGDFVTPSGDNFSVGMWVK